MENLLEYLVPVDQDIKLEEVNARTCNFCLLSAGDDATILCSKQDLDEFIDNTGLDYMKKIKNRKSYRAQDDDCIIVTTIYREVTKKLYADASPAGEELSSCIQEWSKVSIEKYTEYYIELNDDILVNYINKYIK